MVVIGSRWRFLASLQSVRVLDFASLTHLTCQAKGGSVRLQQLIHMKTSFLKAKTRAVHQPKAGQQPRAVFSKKQCLNCVGVRCSGAEATSTRILGVGVRYESGYDGAERIPVVNQRLRRLLESDGVRVQQHQRRAVHQPRAVYEPRARHQPIAVELLSAVLSKKQCLH